MKRLLRVRSLPKRLAVHARDRLLLSCKKKVNGKEKRSERSFGQMELGIGDLKKRKESGQQMRPSLSLTDVQIRRDNHLEIFFFFHLLVRDEV